MTSITVVVPYSKAEVFRAKVRLFKMFGRTNILVNANEVAKRKGVEHIKGVINEIDLKQKETSTLAFIFKVTEQDKEEIQNTAKELGVNKLGIYYNYLAYLIMTESRM